MPVKIEVTLTFDGPFNVGAGALGGSLADKPLTRDARGLPVIPASTFKGRLRHEVERLVPVMRPNEPAPCGSPVAERMCQGDGPVCPVCRLFGSPWLPGKLTFSDLTLAEPKFLQTIEHPPPGALRYGVGLSRQRRVAEDQLLYTTEVFQPGTPITLTGTISGDLTAEEQALLEAGLKSLFSIGGGKSRGLGWFDLAYTVTGEADQPPAVEAEEPSSETLKRLAVIVELESSLLVGTDRTEAFYKTTLTHIPGRVLRGSLARRMLEACSHPAAGPHPDCDFGRLFDCDQPPVFEHLYATTGREFSFPTPLTARSCKYHPGFERARKADEQGHGVGDILIRQTVFEIMLQTHLDGKLSTPLPGLYRPLCPVCGEEVEPFSGTMVILPGTRGDGTPAFFYDNVNVPARRTSRTAINRQRAVSADGQLYTLEVIEPQDRHQRRTRFRGQITASPEQTAILRQWLSRLEAIGQGQSRGLGRVKIEMLSPDRVDNPLPSVSDRLAGFTAAVRAVWQTWQQQVGIDPLPDDTLFFCLTLLSPLSLERAGLPETLLTPERLGFNRDVALIRAFTAFQTRGGWHLGAGLPRRTHLMLAAGSVFMYRSEGLDQADLAQALDRIERTGLGNPSLRRQGFGRVVVCLPFHYQPEVDL